MSAPCQSACSPWITDADLCSPCDAYATDSALLDSAIAVASDVLYELSGKRFPGSCQMTVRPCKQRGCFSFQRGSYGNGPDDFPVSYSDGPRNCGCSRLQEIRLGPGPVTLINEVKVNGAIVDPTLYRVDEYRLLVRLPDPDGTNPGWPQCQDLSLASTEDDTFEVVFTYGVMPPPAGVRAAAELACELIKSCDPESQDQCALPSRVTSVTRQGISMVVLDPFDFLKDGKIGIYACDLFLTTYNPKGLRRQGVVYSPDISPAVRRVGT